jgi:vanillate O-demethylase monooxygenase subunit
MFVKNCWYVAALSGEVGRTPLARTIAGEALVFYRTEAGSPVAMLDRCPHRLVPLSLGTVVGDALQCGYHGIEFGPDGRCVRLPGEDRIAPHFCAQTFPLEERWGFVWIWLGDPDRRDLSMLPDEFRFQTEPGWCPLSDHLRVEANYELLVDNLLDLSHEAFLHTNTIGNAAVAETPARTILEGDRVEVLRQMVDCAPPKLFVRAAGFTGNIDRLQRISYRAPCFVIIEVKATPTGRPDDPTRLVWWVLNALTPETGRSTHYFWGLPRQFRQDSSELTEMLRAGITRTFEEDRQMLEAQQRILDGVSLDTRTVYTRADQAPSRARAQVAALIARESGTAAD